MEIQRSKDPALLHAAHNLLSVIGKRFFQPWIQPELLFRISKHFKVFYDSREVIDNTVKKVIILLRHSEDQFEANCLRFLADSGH